MKKSKFLVGIVALFALGLFFAINAFTNNTSKFADRYWRYNQNTQLGSRLGSNYTLITDPESPGCDDAQQMPCVLKVDQSINTQAKLNTYLSGFTTDADVTAVAIHTKGAQ
ncbi:hypothetical protein ACVWYG_003457 [Pedobacter sp. UYEF25]